jgi:hypothetical protein
MIKPFNSFAAALNPFCHHGLTFFPVGTWKKREREACAPIFHAASGASIKNNIWDMYTTELIELYFKHDRRFKSLCIMYSLLNQYHNKYS